MDYFINFICSECKKPIGIFNNQSKPPICDSCIITKKKTERKQYFSDLDNLSIEKRIRKIEEWIYDNNIEEGVIK